MAKKRSGNIRAYFRKVFDEHPDWLSLSDNSLVLKKWSEDHNNKEPDDRIKQGMSACKSAMRKAAGLVTPGVGRPGRKKGSGAAKSAKAPATDDVKQLETMIYNCEVVANGMNLVKLDPVVKHLRRALAHLLLSFDDNS